MKNCIIDTERNHEKRFQIMRLTGNLYEHYFPGQLFTYDEAVEICKQDNIEVHATGNLWQCLD